MAIHLRRRELIAALGGTAAWSLAARAQQPDRMRRIGLLMATAEDDPETKLRLAGLQQGLEKLGWSEGRNIHLDKRFASAPSEIRQGSSRKRWSPRDLT
jgi:putative ABC transport system substrate-binding protein